MEIINLSDEPLGKLYSWIPHDLQAEKVVFLPDACPGKSPLPTGTVVLTNHENWRKFAVSDCGCGMRLLRSNLICSSLTQKAWDSIAQALRANKGKLGDLGAGNHFLDALVPLDSEDLYFLIHTGSRNESGMVDDLVNKPLIFEKEFARIVDWANHNRSSVQEILEKHFGRLDLIVDLAHNSFERTSDGAVIIRKGAVKVKPGESAVIPSHMTGDILLVKATQRICETLFSMSHGTGRVMSRSAAKNVITPDDISKIKERIMLPSKFNVESLKTEGPQAYRDLDECFTLISDYVTIIDRYRVIAYMGHL